MKKGDTPESQTAGTVWHISELVECQVLGVIRFCMLKWLVVLCLNR